MICFAQICFTEVSQAAPTLASSGWLQLGRRFSAPRNSIVVDAHL
jgi:hypothetical protein